MELAIVRSNLERTEIKPRESLDQYIKHLETSNQRFFQANLTTRTCPACGSTQKKVTFDKCGLPFAECAECLTLYVEKVPALGDVIQFYLESEARNYWQETIWKTTQAARVEKIFKPMAEWIIVHANEVLSRREHRFLELYPTHDGLMKGFQKFSGFGQYKIAQSMFRTDLQEADPEEKFDVVILMDAICRIPDPEKLFIEVQERLIPGGLCCLTTVFSTGLDVLILGKESDVVLPPDRLNLFSYEGMKSFITKFNFELMELSTPGVLDLQNLRNTQAEIPKFFTYLFENRKNDNLLHDFQDFLQSNALSSLGRIVLRKKG